MTTRRATEIIIQDTRFRVLRIIFVHYYAPVCISFFFRREQERVISRTGDRDLAPAGGYENNRSAETTSASRSARGAFREEGRDMGDKAAALAACICTRASVYPVCGPVITGGNKPIPGYGACLNTCRDPLP